jgi:hypothetical protein
MNVEAQLKSLKAALQVSVHNDTTASAATVQEWLAELNEINARLDGLNSAVQRVADVNSGFALMAHLLEAAHTDKLDADQVWCLIEPLREKLERAIDDVRLAM